MSKLCWKCGNPHEDGDAYCLKCGASFASDDMRYQTDGRTVSNKDDSAYLSAPPPNYKKGHGKVIAVAVIVLLAIAVAVILLGSSGSSSDVGYDYMITEERDLDPEESPQIVYRHLIVMDVAIKNNKMDQLDLQEVIFKMNVNGKLYQGWSDLSGTLAKGGVVKGVVTVYIPEEAKGDPKSLSVYSYYGDWSAGKDDSLL